MVAHTDGLEVTEPLHTSLKARSLAKPRLSYLDSLRTMLITSVVIAHLSITYGGTLGDWYYVEGGKTTAAVNIIVVLLGVIGVGFAMGLLFAIAGYFSPAAYDRKGAGQFLFSRLKRLGIPWLISELTLVPLVNYLVDLHGGTNCKGGFYDCNFQGSLWQYLINYPRNQGSISDGPDWFLEALLIFSVGYVLWRLATRSVRMRAPDDASWSHGVPGNGTIGLFALAIGLGTFVVRIWTPVFVYYPPWSLEFAHFPQYIALFAAGVWAYRVDWLATFSDRQSRIWRWVALVCVMLLPVLLAWVGVLSGTIDPRVGGGVNWMSLAYSMWEGFLCVSMVITFLTWYRRRFAQQTPLGQAMSRSAFAVYILHLGVLVPLALALSGIQMNLSLKFLLVMPIGVALSYLIALALLKVPIIRSILG